jgi:hypothetical protein
MLGGDYIKGLHKYQKSGGEKSKSPEVQKAEQR